MIVLASASPRRKELLKLIVDNFCIAPSDIDETVEENIETEKYPEYLARKKAEYVFENGHQGDTVIGCDTGVFIDGKMLGKPKNKDDAKQMLSKLSGRVHRVITGCCVIKNDRAVSFSQTTEVEFYILTPNEIDEYTATGEPLDKAGSYGIQGRGALLVKGINGDYFNVVGLPVAALNRVMKNLDAN